MHRKHIRATVDGGDIDIPIGTFVDLQYLTYQGGQIITAPLVLPEGDVSGPASSTDNAIVRWDGTSGTSIQNSIVVLSDLGQVTGVTALNGRDIAQWVDGPSVGSTTLNHVAIWIDEGGRDIADSGLHIGDIVRNQDAEVTAGHLAEFGDSTGRVLVDSGVIADHVVTSPSTSTDNALARWDGTSGKVVQNSIVLLSDTGQITGVTALNTRDIAQWVDGPSIGGATDNAVARWDTTTGRLLQDSSVVIADDGAITGVSSINGADIGDFVVGPTPAEAVSGDLAVWDGTSGRLIADGGLSIFDVVHTFESEVVSGHLPAYADSAGRELVDSGIISANVVTSASVGDDNRLARYDGAGRAIQSSTVTVSDAGAFSGVSTINGIDITALGDVFGPASSTDNRVTRFDGATGKLIQQSAVTLDDSGNLTGVGTINGYALGSWGDASGPSSSTDNRIARFDGTTGKLLQQSAIAIDDSGNLTGVGTVNGNALATGDVVGPVSTTDNLVARFDGSSGKLIQDSSVAIGDSGDISGVGTINGMSPGNWVRGPASASNANIPAYNGTSGKTIYDTGIASSMLAPYTPTAGLPFVNEIACFDGSSPISISYRVVQIDSLGNLTNVGTVNGIVLNTLVSSVGTFSADNRVLRSDGTARAAQASAVSIDDSGNISGAGTLNGITISSIVTSSFGSAVNDIPYFTDTSGQVIRSSGLNVNNILSTATVGSGTDNAVVRFDGTTNKVTQNSLVTISDTGAVAGVTNITMSGTLNSRNPSDFVAGPASVSDNRVARFDSTTGKLIQQSVVVIDDSGNITGAGTYNSVNVASHGLRHCPGGADPIASTSVSACDILQFGGSNAVFAPKYFRTFTTTSGTASGSYLTVVPNAYITNRAGTNVQVLIIIPYAISDTGSDIQVLVQWGDCSGRAVVMCGSQGGHITSSGSTGTFDTATGNGVPLAGAITIQFTAQSVGANAYVAVGIRSTGSSHTIYAGTFHAIEDNP